jgi:hypothetical protein
MTFEEWWTRLTGANPNDVNLKHFAKRAWEVGQANLNLDCPHQRVGEMGLPVCDLAARQVNHIVAAIRKHYEQRADDRCWMDDVELYVAAGLPVPHDATVGSKAEMLKNCERFLERRCVEGGAWKTYAELEAENERLRRCLFQLQDAAKQLADLLRNINEKEKTDGD